MVDIKKRKVQWVDVYTYKGNKKIIDGDNVMEGSERKKTLRKLCIRKNTVRYRIAQSESEDRDKSGH